MFRMDNKTKEILSLSSWKSKREEFANKRQKVYRAITENSNIKQNKDLAEAAGFDMSNSMSDEYHEGAQFISRMLRGGYIEKQLGKDGEIYFYVTNKEPVLYGEGKSQIKVVHDDEEKAAELLQQEIEENGVPEGYRLKEEPESLREARENFAKELAEYEPEPREEDQLYSGCLSIGKVGSKGNIQIKFSDKTQADIINIINGLELEDIL